MEDIVRSFDGVVVSRGDLGGGKSARKKKRNRETP